MNFTFTKKKAGVFIAGLIGASLFSTLVDSPQAGALIMVGVIAYLARTP